VNIAAIKWGKETGGLRSRIWTATERIGKNDPIAVHYSIQNVAKEPKTVWHSGFSANNRIDVTGPDGKPAKAIGSGNTHLATFPARTREKNAPFVLQPGATDEAYIVYNLRDFFDMQAPGTYTVQYVHQETEKEEPVKSNSLKVIIE
jgi:hypothetical protein